MHKNNFVVRKISYKKALDVISLSSVVQSAELIEVFKRIWKHTIFQLAVKAELVEIEIHGKELFCRKLDVFHKRSHAILLYI